MLQRLERLLLTRPAEVVARPAADFTAAYPRIARCGPSRTTTCLLEQAAGSAPGLALAMLDAGADPLAAPCRGVGVLCRAAGKTYEEHCRLISRLAAWRGLDLASKAGHFVLVMDDIPFDDTPLAYATLSATRFGVLGPLRALLDAGVPMVLHEKDGGRFDAAE